jgi:alpha-acetolactate decarboxylase
MPITRELDNLKKLESVGFSHEQAETLADVIEKSHVDSQESLKEFIHSENTNLENKIDSKISGLETRLMASQKDLLIKIFGIIVGTVGIAVTILKLFP